MINLPGVENVKPHGTKKKQRTQKDKYELSLYSLQIVFVPAVENFWKYPLLSEFL